MADIDPTTLADSIAKKLGEAFGRAPARDDDEDDLGTGRVPRDRFARVLEERNNARKQLEELKRQFEEYQGATKSHLEKIQIGAAEEVKRIGMSHQEDLSLVELGIRDPLGRRAIREAWENEDKDRRGKSPSEWWRTTTAAREAHLADPEKAPAPNIPRTLMGYLPEPPAPPKEAPKSAPQRKGPPEDGGRRSGQDKGILDGLKPDASPEEMLRYLRG